jgi:intracellular sulfur oxidation DsrE/DsrF family protein
MNRKAFIQGAALALALSTTVAMGAVAQTASPARAKVVFQVSDGDAGKWALALNNAKNVQQELGAGKVDIEIVAYGPGIGMLKADATTSNRITEAVKSGIQVIACENTMTTQKLTKADMNPAIAYVPAGVVELMKRQAEGWAYIRP